MSARTSEGWKKTIGTLTNGRTYQDMLDLPAGVHVSPEAAANPKLARTLATLRELAPKYLGPESRVYIGDAVKTAGAKGEVMSIGNVHMIGLGADSSLDTLHTGMHELGHAIFHEKARYIPNDLMSLIRKDYAEFLENLLVQSPKAVEQRFAITNRSAKNDAIKSTPYAASFDEYMAEQYVKHLIRLTANKDPRLTASLRGRIVEAVKAVMAFFSDAKKRGLFKSSDSAHEFYNRVLDGQMTQAKRMEQEFLSPGLVFPQGAATSANLDVAGIPAGPRTDADIMRDYGIDIMRADSASQRAQQAAMVHLYRKAEVYPMPDKARMSKLLQAKPLSGLAPTALKLLASENPVARMAAAELLESGSGAAGRRSTAAIAKWRDERLFMGNAINDFERAYTEWRNVNGGNMLEDHIGGKRHAEFNKLVAVEMENRLGGRVSDHPPTVHAAADVLEAAYERMRAKQVAAKTPGWQALPDSSFGYMPHRMQAAKLREASPETQRVLHGVLAEQFQRIEGFDEAFSGSLASRYIETIKTRATTGQSAPIGVHNAEAADIVEEAAAAMGMSRDEAQALGRRVLRAQPAHTRHRLQLDLTRTYIADGKEFRLLDLFETDQLGLLHSQASRVSGETALMRHGIPGGTGLKLIRQAMADFGRAGAKADNATLEAFDQVSAEMLGRPFGSKSQWLDRAMQFNSLASLGGMGFNQLAETINGALTLGTRHALASVSSFGRLRSEILALARGERVDNPIIGSLETYGAEFGTDAYKMVFPFDMPDRIHETYGVDTLTAGDRLLRGGVALQGKLSLWRAISSAQQRGIAEQIVHKALRYIREGKDDVALADMGVTPELAATLRQSLDKAATFDGSGRLTAFDITKIENGTAADEFVTAVHRGTQQIIQGHFIGETGKWAHSSLLKLMTQFRTFSLVAIDKQWNRQVGNHGTAKALGMLLGTMSIAAPIYMVRMGLQSVGRPDKEEFLEKRLHPSEIARQTLNYVALSGLAGDLLDALSAIGGFQPTGGRTGANKSFTGNVIAPAAGKVNDIWGALQDNRQGTDVHELVKNLPFSRLPWLIPAVNALKHER
jgi:hypothetical protein